MNKIEWYKKEFQDISKSINKKDSLSMLDFLKIRNFKLQNSSLATEKKIKQITAEAFKLAKQNKIEEAIDKLCKIYGVRIPIASTILATRFPNKYAIIDINVIKALGKKDIWKKYVEDSAIYKEYTLLIRDMAKKKKMKLRDLEFELFLKGKKK